jgi:hypothetical protein
MSTKLVIGDIGGMKNACSEMESMSTREQIRDIRQKENRRFLLDLFDS